MSLSLNNRHVTNQIKHKLCLHAAFSLCYHITETEKYFGIVKLLDWASIVQTGGWWFMSWMKGVEGLLLALGKKHDKLVHIQSKRGRLQMTDSSAEPTKSAKTESIPSAGIFHLLQIWVERLLCGFYRAEFCFFSYKLLQHVWNNIAADQCETERSQHIQINKCSLRGWLKVKRGECCLDALLPPIRNYAWIHCFLYAES